MVKNDLIERYIYAVTKDLSRQTREDVSKELHSLIIDMLEERCGELKPTEHDIHVVLTELGQPKELAEKYNHDEDKYLIGPTYYGQYKMTLKIVLPCVILGMVVSSLIGYINEPDIQWYSLVAELVGSTVGGTFFAFSIVTLLFAIFQYKKIDIDVYPNSLDDLPAVPKEKERISKKEVIFGIGFSVLFMTLFLMAPQIFSVVLTQEGRVIPIFNIEFIRSTWYIVIIFGILGIVREIFRLIHLRYNIQVMVVTIITNVISAFLAIFWLRNDHVINPVMITELSNLFVGEAFIVNLLSNIQNVFLCLILFALVLDIIITVLNTNFSGNMK